MRIFATRGIRGCDEFPLFGGAKYSNRCLYLGYGKIMRLMPYAIRFGAIARPNVFAEAAYYSGRSPPPSGLETLATKRAPPGHRPRFSRAINPPRYSVKITGAFLFAARPMPLYSRATLPACRVGRRCRAQAVRREEYPDLSPYVRGPEKELVR